MRIDEQLSKIESALLKSAPVSMRTGAPEARILIAKQAGEPIVAVKSFASGNSHDFEPGERIDASQWPDGRLAIMAQHRYVAPEAEWHASLEYNKRFAVMQSIEPLKEKLTGARRSAMQAASKVAELKAKLMLAERQAEDATALVEICESDLAAALQAPELQALIS